MGLKLQHASKRGPRSNVSALFTWSTVQIQAITQINIDNWISRTNVSEI